MKRDTDRRTTEAASLMGAIADASRGRQVPPPAPQNSRQDGAEQDNSSNQIGQALAFPFFGFVRLGC